MIAPPPGLRKKKHVEVKSMIDAIEISILKKQVCAMKSEKVASTPARSVSVVDRERNVMVVSAKGVSMAPENMAVISLQDGRQVDGFGTPHPDYEIHMEVYRAYPEITSILIFSAEKINSFCRSGQSIPVYSATHAKNFRTEIPCTRNLTESDYENDYMSATGRAVVDAIETNHVEKVGAVLIRYEGALVWNQTPITALESARALVDVATIASNTLAQSPDGLDPMPQGLADRYFREAEDEIEVMDGVESAGEPGRAITKRDQKKISLELLAYFDKVCREHDIKYSLTGGTLLGAVRHSAFIPWDDDVDVFLARPEYEKLEKAFDNEGKRFVFANRNTQKKFNFVYSRILDTKTLITESPNTRNAGAGLFLDICVVDGLPNNRLLRKIHMLYMRALVRCCRATIHNTDKAYHRRGRLFVMMKSIIRALTTHQFWNRRMEKAMNRFSFEKSKFVGNFTSQYGNREMLHKEAFDSYYDIWFEGHKYMICQGYQEYLQRIYGSNYMALPPKSKQKGHHVYKAYWLK